MSETSNSSTPGSECVFCMLAVTGHLEEIDRTGVYHFEPLNPVVPGHRLFMTSEHFVLPHESPSLTGLLFNAAAWYAGQRGGDYNLIVNGGPAASQTVNHVHVHYVPRVDGDGLTLPWTGQRRG